MTSHERQYFKLKQTDQILAWATLKGQRFLADVNRSFRYRVGISYVGYGIIDDRLYSFSLDHVQQPSYQGLKPGFYYWHRPEKTDYTMADVIPIEAKQRTIPLGTFEDL